MSIRDNTEIQWQEQRKKRWETKSVRGASSQYDLNEIVIGHTAEGDIKGTSCDYVETDFPLTLSNVHVKFKGGALADFSTRTLTLNGDCILEIGYLTTVHMLNTLVLGNGSILSAIDPKVSNISIPVGSAQLKGYMQDVNYPMTAFTGSAILFDCVIDVLGTMTGGHISFRNFTSGNINTLNSTIDIYNSYIDAIGTLSGACISNNSSFFVETCNAALDLTNSRVVTIDCTGNIACFNSYYLASHSINNTNSTFWDSIVIMAVGTLNTSLILNGSNCNLSYTVAGALKVDARNSYINIVTPISPIFSFGLYSTCTIFHNGGVGNQIIFGDGTPANDTKESNIKIKASIGGAGLTIVDNPGGIGTSYSGNVFEVQFNSITLNLTGGATNILKLTGRTAGITTTANTYTTFNTNY